MKSGFCFAFFNSESFAETEVTERSVLNNKTAVLFLSNEQNYCLITKVREAKYNL